MNDVVGTGLPYQTKQEVRAGCRNTSPTHLVRYRQEIAHKGRSIIGNDKAGGLDQNVLWT